MSVLVVLLPWLAAAAASLAALLQARARMREAAAGRVLRAALADAEARLRAAPAVDGSAEGAEERRHQDELRRRNEHLAGLGRMLAGTAHELNNPLAAISGFAQLLLRSPMRAEERTALETIDHEARRAAAVVRDLLTFARRGTTVERRRVDLNAVARYIVGTRRYALETSGIVVELALVDGELPVLADATQLEQVVLNLVANAHEALEGDAARARDARITVRTALGARAAVLEVVDTGPGISRDDLARIWDPFFTTKGATDGTGLGLSVVHRLVTDHGGTIDAESGAGGGARFRVVLPLAGADERADAAHGPAPQEELAREALDVLVAEPDAEAADFLARYLRTRGHAVIVAHDATQAALLATDDAFDVVIASARLAEADDAFVRRVREGGGRPRCVVVTEAADGEDDAAGPWSSAGGCAVLERPFQIEQLRHAVEDG